MYLVTLHVDTTGVGHAYLSLFSIGEVGSSHPATPHLVTEPVSAAIEGLPKPLAGSTVTAFGMYPASLPPGYNAGDIPGVVKHDTNHPYDTSVTLEITKEQYDAMLTFANTVAQGALTGTYVYNSAAAVDFDSTSHNCSTFTKAVLDAGGVVNAGALTLGIPQGQALEAAALSTYLSEFGTPTERFLNSVIPTQNTNPGSIAGVTALALLYEIDSQLTELQALKIIGGLGLPSDNPQDAGWISQFRSSFSGLDLDANSARLIPVADLGVSTLAAAAASGNFAVQKSILEGRPFVPLKKNSDGSFGHVLGETPQNIWTDTKYWQDRVELLHTRLREAELSSPLAGVGNSYVQVEVNFLDFDAGRHIDNAAESTVVFLSSSSTRFEGASGKYRVWGSTLNDDIKGEGSDDELYGGQGDDRLTGGLGNDTYGFRAGDGNDSVNETGGTNDKLKLSGVRASQATFYRSGDDLVLDFGTRADSVTIKSWYLSDANKVDSVEFADGAVYDKTVLEEMAGELALPDGGGNLYPDWNAVDFSRPVVFVGGAGTQRYSSTSDRASIVLFGAGDGADEIYLQGGDIAIRLAPSLQNDFSVTPDFYGAVRLAWTSGDSLLLDRLDSPDIWWPPTNVTVRLTDGSTLTSNDILNRLVNSPTDGRDALHANSSSPNLYAYGGNDELWGNTGNNILNGGTGDDHLYGNGGQDWYIGEGGHDTLNAYAPNAGSTFVMSQGSDTDDLYLYNTQAGKLDTLRVTRGADYAVSPTKSDLEFTRISWGEGIDYYDLKVSIRGTDDAVIIHGFKNPSLSRECAIDRIVFDDGSVMTYEEMRAAGEADYDPTTIRGTAADDYLYGDGVATNILGEAGSDHVYGSSSQVETLRGGTGVDYIFANSGDIVYGDGATDYLYGTNGAETFRWAAGDGYDFVQGAGGADIVQFVLDQGAYSVTAKKAGSSLVLSTGAGQGLQLDDWFNGNNRAAVELPNGVVWDSTALTAQFRDARYATVFEYSAVPLNNAQLAFASLPMTSALTRAAGDPSNPFINMASWLPQCMNKSWAYSGTSDYGTSIYTITGSWGVWSDYNSISATQRTGPIDNYLTDMGKITASVFQDVNGAWQVVFNNLTVATMTYATMMSSSDIDQTIAQYGQIRYSNPHHQVVVDAGVSEVNLYSSATQTGVLHVDTLSSTLDAALPRFAGLRQLDRLDDPLLLEGAILGQAGAGRGAVYAVTDDWSRFVVQAPDTAELIENDSAIVPVITVGQSAVPEAMWYL